MSKAPRDEDGIPLQDGDYITFTFGIPPTCVTCRLTKDTKDWKVECLHPADVKPRTILLKHLTTHYQIWKAAPQRVAAILRTFEVEPKP